MKQNEPNLEKAESTQDLSMEEILASIRRIVTDEPTSETAAGAPQILELTQMVSEDGAVVDIRTAQVAPDYTSDEILKTQQIIRKSPLQQGREDMNRSQKASADILISNDIAETIAQQLFKLNQANLQAQQTYANGPGGATLESLTRDIIRPYLHEWLDKNFEDLVARLLKKWLEKNLPELVERVVNDEIRKLTLTDEEI
ncbi:MAG: hypothetical protein BGO28_01845 [Alphaproteobacteria bacterium 43-37]|nr:MAG: hypothetical protein BGO28_01845 [Alphaproteobacteria bacterium 43-37]